MEEGHFGGLPGGKRYRVIEWYRGGKSTWKRLLGKRKGGGSGGSWGRHPRAAADVGGKFVNGLSRKRWRGGPGPRGERSAKKPEEKKKKSPLRNSKGRSGVGRRF